MNAAGPHRRPAAVLLLAAGLAAASGLAACGDTGATGPRNAAESTIVAAVTADGSPLPGITVELYAEAGTTVLETATTDAGGEAAFVDLIAGTYDVEITVPAGYTVESGGSTRRTVIVDQAARTTVAFALVSAP